MEFPHGKKTYPFLDRPINHNLNRYVAILFSSLCTVLRYINEIPPLCINLLNGVTSDGATIDYVTPLARDETPCGPNALGYQIGITTQSPPPVQFYIYFGGLLAAPYKTSELGDVVPANLGVAN